MRAVLAVAVLVVAGLAGCFASSPADEATDEEQLVTGGFSGTHVLPGDYAIDVEHAQLIEPGSYEALEPEVVAVTSSLDGVELALMVVRPDVPENTTVPVIMTASPYFEPLAGAYVEDDTQIGKTYKRFGAQFVPHGYAFAFLAMRGTSSSGGCIDYQGPKDTNDINAAVEWLAGQGWSNGNIGAIGISWDGSYAWQAAASGNPHVKTVVPIAGMPDWFSGRFRNGTAHGDFASEGALAYGLLGVDRSPLRGHVAPANWAEHVACPTMAEFTSASDYSGATGERDPAGFWAERDWRQKVIDNYQGSAFVVHGLNDLNVPSSQSLPLAPDLAAAGRPVKLMLGQFIHEVPGDPDGGDLPSEHVRWDWMQLLKHWFDYWLKGDTSVDLGPPVQVEDVFGTWRSDTEWPAANTSASTLYLGPDGGLLDEPSPSSSDILISGTDECPDCPTFATQPLDESMRFAGITPVPLTVTPTGPGGHVTAHLLVEKGGETTVVAWGIIDLRFAAGGETAQPVTPGEPLTVRLALEPTDVEVPAGGRLLLRVHQAGYGRYEPPPVHPVTLHVGGDLSQVRLTTLDVPDDAFFTPPR